MSDTDIHQLAAAYALDAVDDRERAAFEAHYHNCPVCRPEVAGFRETLSQVAAISAVPPPASLKTGVMAAIGETRQLSPLLPESVVDLASHRQRRQRLMRTLTAAAALVVIGIGAFVVGRKSGDDDGYAQAAAAVLGRPDTRITTLDGTGLGSFRVAWSPSANRAVVIGDGLPDPGPGKAYELWLVDDAGPHAVRLLDKANDQKVRRVLPVDGSASQWAITVEPEAGVDTATGEIIFSGAA
ncbi:MAG: anti-sigma factor [Ilumatobacteraceae bacterium]